MNLLREICLRHELLHNLVSRNLKSRYKDSVLGFLWSVLTPFFMAVIYVLFLRILARGIPMEEVLIGVFAWQFTAQCVNNGMTSITDNANLVKKVYFPRIILPLAATISNLINFLLTLVVQFILVGLLLAGRGDFMDIHTLAVPLLITGHVLFCLALAVFLSCINVYFRDIQHLVGVGMTAWFFLSPAMYSLTLVEDIAGPRLMNIYLLNPMAIIITGYRALILKNSCFPWGWPVAGATLIATVFLILSIALFQKLQRNFSDVF